MLYRLLYKLALRKVEKLGYTQIKLDKPDCFVSAKFVKETSANIKDTVTIFGNSETFCIKKKRNKLQKRLDGSSVHMKTVSFFEAEEMIWFAIILKNVKADMDKLEKKNFGV